MAPPNPDFVIGVDFGMTQTGVAYAIAPWTTPIKTFQKWKRMYNEIVNKVPTRLQYDPRNHGVSAWGSGCNYHDNPEPCKEFFKLALDPTYRDEWTTHEEAKQYFRDFLTQLRMHLVKYFSNTYPSWEYQRVEWLFSVPTTWRNAAWMPTLLELIESAGFGEKGPHHSCRITLTEAEAAAVCVAHQQMKKGQVIVVCDAGGGTTDVNVLKVTSDANEPLELTPLLKVEGQAIGSALIDSRVQRLLFDKLQHIAHRLPMSPEEIAEKTMFEKFEPFKCALGSGELATPQLFLDITDLPQGTDVPALGIHDSQIAISRAQVQEAFDLQVNKLIKLVDGQIQQLQGNEPGERIAFLVLSGGFGSSSYLQDRLKAHFWSGHGSRLQNTKSMKLLIAEEPQLAVVNGLVQERVQALRHHKSPFQQRCARISYGVVANHRYRSDLHLNEDPFRDPYDGKLWVRDQVEWLIKEGDQISKLGVAKNFHAKITGGQLHLPWRAQFVQCAEKRQELPRGELPRNVHSETVQKLCHVQVNLEHVHKLVKNDRWWHHAKRYHEAEFEVRIIPESATLRFELVNQGRLVNDQGDSVEVEWEPPESSSKW